MMSTKAFSLNLCSYTGQPVYLACSEFPDIVCVSDLTTLVLESQAWLLYDIVSRHNALLTISGQSRL